MIGKKNIAIGFLFLAGFMVHGVLLVYLRDFAPAKDAWIAGYAAGSHAEARMAHVHGALFATLNVIIGYLLIRLPVAAAAARAISWLAIAGLLMPVGILLKLGIGLPPVLVLLGVVSMIAAVTWFGVVAITMKPDASV